MVLKSLKSCCKFDFESIKPFKTWISLPEKYFQTFPMIILLLLVPQFSTSRKKLIFRSLYVTLFWKRIWRICQNSIIQHEINCTKQLPFVNTAKKGLKMKRKKTLLPHFTSFFEFEVQTILILEAHCLFRSMWISCKTNEWQTFAVFLKNFHLHSGSALFWMFPNFISNTY